MEGGCGVAVGCGVGDGGKRTGVGVGRGVGGGGNVTGVAVGWAVGSPGKVTGVDVGWGVSVGRAAKTVATLSWAMRRISSSDRVQPVNANRTTRVNAMPRWKFTVRPWNGMARRKNDGRSHGGRKAINSSVDAGITLCQRRPDSCPALYLRSRIGKSRNRGVSRGVSTPGKSEG